MSAQPPPPPGTPPPPPPMPPTPPNFQQPGGMPPAPGSSGKATASLVLGIVGIVFCPLICSVLAIVLGSQAKSDIAASGGMIGGEDMAKWGVILGWIGLGIVVAGILLAVMLGVFTATAGV